MKGKNWERKNKEIRGTFNWFDANWMKSNFDSAPRIYVARAFRLERSWKYYLSTLALWEKEDYVKSTLFLKWLRFKSSNVVNGDSNDNVEFGLNQNENFCKLCKRKIHIFKVLNKQIFIATSNIFRERKQLTASDNWTNRLSTSNSLMKI